MLIKFLHQNRIYVSLVFFFLVIVIYAGFSYESKKEDILKTVDEKLLSTAIATQAIIGHNFADKSINGSSISEQEDMQNILNLSKFAKASDVKYIYIMIQDGNITRFITSSATDDEIATGKQLTRYYDSYDNNKNISKAFKTKQVIFDASVEDKWGYFRSVFVPYTTPDGKGYVVGVDVDLNFIETLSRKAAIKEVIGSLLILLSLSPILYLLNLFKKDNSILQSKIDEATQELKEINNNLQEKVKHQTMELIEQFYHDTLTDLPNRNRLQEELKKSNVVAIAILNIDDFKEINDFFGSGAGDNILIQFAKFVNFIHPTYRLAGDEFAMIFEDTFSKEEIKKAIENITQKVEEQYFFVDSQIINLRLSVGIAYGNNANITSADIAMHQAKAKKIPIWIYNEDEKIETHFQYNLEMANTIKQALTNSKIVCHFQPIVSCTTEKIEKYEALVRLLNEENEIVHPVAFLKLAQKTKYYPQITCEVVRQACTTFSNRPEQFSVNLSSSDITNQKTVDFILKTMQETNTSDRIIFEIIEAEGIENFEAVSSFIETVKSMGARIAIDDFGTGYSSFENILKLNIDYIKIDGSLIRNIDTNMRHSIVVETIVDFAKKIGAKTIAEYVCNEDIYTKAKKLDIDYAQGYYIGKPCEFTLQ